LLDDLDERAQRIVHRSTIGKEQPTSDQKAILKFRDALLDSKKAS